jgi:hypothetical protein
MYEAYIKKKKKKTMFCCVNFTFILFDFEFWLIGCRRRRRCCC